METNELHRGRLIDHLQLVVRDLEASRTFYRAVFDVLGVPMGGESDDYFWADELFVSTADSQAAHGELTGRHHLAFQAQDRAIRAEENFRHYLLTGKPLDSRLRVSQIVALRFASDAEFPGLAVKAADEKLKNEDIKKLIQNWRADHHRV